MKEPELLFTELLDCDMTALCLKGQSRVDHEKLKQAAGVLKRRITGEPVQYILGTTEFFGLIFKVTKDVFIPRPETEILVEAVIRYVSRTQNHKDTSIDILDIGTGSGCIAISLAKFIDNCKIAAIDISGDAVSVAKHNAGLNGVSDKIDFFCFDVFDLQLAACNLKPGSFDITVSNPPYIPSREIENLQAEISYEPSIALDGGRDGLDFYRKISSHARQYLKKGGYLIMEMGFGQRASIEKIFQGAGDFKIREVIKDYGSIDRVIIFEKE